MGVPALARVHQVLLFLHPPLPPPAPLHLSSAVGWTMCSVPSRNTIRPPLKNSVLNRSLVSRSCGHKGKHSPNVWQGWSQYMFVKVVWHEIFQTEVCILVLPCFQNGFHIWVKIQFPSMGVKSLTSHFVLREKHGQLHCFSILYLLFFLCFSISFVFYIGNLFSGMHMHTGAWVVTSLDFKILILK